MNDVSDSYKLILEKLPPKFTEEQMTEQLAAFAGTNPDDPLFLGGAEDLFRISVEKGIIRQVEDSPSSSSPSEDEAGKLFELNRPL